MLTKLLVLFASSLAFGCTTETTITTTDSDLCAALDDHDQRCGEQTISECDLDQSRIRPEVLESMTACVRALSCDEPDDRCFDEALADTPARDVDKEFSDRCLDNAASCGLETDFCDISILFEAPHVETAIGCFDTCDFTTCVAIEFGID